MLFLIFSREKFSESGCSILEACNKEGWSAWNLMIYCLDPQNIFFQLGNVSKTAVYDIEIFLLKKFLMLKLEINVNNIKNYINIISIKKFNTLYGHIKDEMFILSDFYEKYNNSSFLPLINYPNDAYYNNMNEIQKIILHTCVNPEYENVKLIKMKKLIIVDHHYNLETFHLFPKNITNKIFSYFNNNNIINNINNNNNINKIFLIRDKTTWQNNNINNNLDLINISKQKGFIITNPEIIKLDELVNKLKNTDILIITFGSALVNLIYTKVGCQVIILKSTSYKSHDIKIFRNLMKNYNINYKIIECNDDNNIDINLFSKTI
jgi:hypothetical protein